MAETFVELNELFMHHGVTGELSLKFLLLRSCRQLAMQKSITAVYEITLLCQVVNVITVHADSVNLVSLLAKEQSSMIESLPSVHKNAFLAIYERDFGVTGPCKHTN